QFLIVLQQRTLELFAQISREIDERHGLGFGPEATDVRVKLISLVGIFRKELFSSGVVRRGSWAVIQPIELIGGGKNQGRVRGLECIGGAFESGGTSLGRDSTMPPKGVPRPTYQSR